MAEDDTEVEEQTADDAEIEAEGDEEGAPKKGGKKFLFIIIGAVLLLGGGGAGAYFFLMGDSSSEVHADVDAQAEAAKAFYTLPNIMVNLNSQGQKQEYLKVTISLEMKDQSAVDSIMPKVDRIQDVFQVYLRELRQSDLEGSAGMYRLKEELRKRVNIAIYPQKVDDILFKEILVQ